MPGAPSPTARMGRCSATASACFPPQEYGWYREYTIPTPGSPDRGAARFVVGEDETFFYTDDHYASFSEVIV
ncbi:MAG: ribonuclease domain-containing protein [Candidatus Nanopelagicales bacterium]